MDNMWLSVVFLVFGIYYLYRFFSKKDAKTKVESAGYSDILAKEEYKIKGQWER